MFSQAGNPDLSWETSKKTDIGINFGLFEDRLTGEVTYFKNLIDGLILAAPQSPSKGVPGNSISTNVGSMQNVGWEFSLNGTILRKSKLSWTSNFNFTFMENEVLSLAAGNADILVSTAGLETANIIGEGFRTQDLVRLLQPYPGKSNVATVNPSQSEYIWPIPQGELNVNKLAVQNP